MKVVHAQAERILKEYGDDGVPGFSTLEFTLGSPDEFGHADLTITNNAHASPEAFAAAAGIMPASPPAPEVDCIELPKIIGLPNVGQYVNLSAGVWAEPSPETVGSAAVTPTGVQIRWLYDGNEEDPVVIPEGDPHGLTELLLPSASIGKTIQVRVTRGATTVYSEPFGPIEGGLTEFTFPAEPVRDSTSVSADPGSRRRDGGSARGTSTRSRAQTPSSATKSRGAAKRASSSSQKKASAGKATSKTGAPKKVSESKKQALAKRAAKEKTPLPAADRRSV